MKKFLLLMLLSILTISVKAQIAITNYTGVPITDLGVEFDDFSCSSTSAFYVGTLAPGATATVAIPALESVVRVGFTIGGTTFEISRPVGSCGPVCLPTTYPGTFLWNYAGPGVCDIIKLDLFP